MFRRNIGGDRMCWVSSSVGLYIQGHIGFTSMYLLSTFKRDLRVSYLGVFPLNPVRLEGTWRVYAGSGAAVRVWNPGLVSSPINHHLNPKSM